jgi:hypothetical protein
MERGVCMRVQEGLGMLEVKEERGREGEEKRRERKERETRGE